MILFPLQERCVIQIIRGKVVTGVGEGRHFVSMTGYIEQFNQRLGFDPYPGTLNLKVSKPFEGKDAYAIVIDGFRDERGCYGPCKCYPATIEGIRCAIIRPERSRYPLDIVEVIAHVNLRKTLDISEADEVDIILE